MSTLFASQRLRAVVRVAQRLQVLKRIRPTTPLRDHMMHVCGRSPAPGFVLTDWMTIEEHSPYPPPVDSIPSIGRSSALGIDLSRVGLAPSAIRCASWAPGETARVGKFTRHRSNAPRSYARHRPAFMRRWPFPALTCEQRRCPRYLSAPARCVPGGCHRNQPAHLPEHLWL